MDGFEFQWYLNLLKEKQISKFDVFVLNSVQVIYKFDDFINYTGQHEFCDWVDFFPLTLLIKKNGFRGWGGLRVHLEL